ncbi:MAG: hypothetical protein D6732_24335 [Methanobacteriota archaeon]|nr:MAG: hypothetical protein D6732_24335 [Euryarchaeota archaeon]
MPLLFRWSKFIFQKKRDKMSVQEIIQEIKKLPQKEQELLLSHFFSDEELVRELERLGFLKLSENSFAFWNDPREDIYQDYLELDNQEK